MANNSNSREIDFKQVDFSKHGSLCFEFRRDAHFTSYGNTQDFNESEYRDWFNYLLENNLQGFFHVWLGSKIIGQLEFKPDLEAVDENGMLIRYSYINFFYLIPEYRNLGIGKQLHDFVINQCREAGSQEVYLRYIPGNIQAKAFYRKNGWMFSGEPDHRGQLMVLDLT